MKKYIILAAAFIAFNQQEAGATWYQANVEQVSSRAANNVEALYILTELNPNPANCATTWAGARWNGVGVSVGLAASTALTAKVTGKLVRFSIDDANCDVSGLPIMNWITIEK